MSKLFFLKILYMVKLYIKGLLKHKINVLFSINVSRQTPWIAMKT